MPSGTQSRQLRFHCECGRASCVETIEIPPARYATIVRERYRFVVISGHEEPPAELAVAKSVGIRREDVAPILSR
ncbi:MAG TPA: hypothetical protein VIM33_11650 [Gaiellaceae bacterium]